MMIEFKNIVYLFGLAVSNGHQRVTLLMTINNIQPIGLEAHVKKEPSLIFTS